MFWCRASAREKYHEAEVDPSNVVDSRIVVQQAKKQNESTSAHGSSSRLCSAA